MMKLLPKQNNAIYYWKDRITREIIYGGAAGGGKSALDALILIESCQKYPSSRWLLGRSKLKTLKETTLNTFFELSSKLKISNQFKYNGQSDIITWNNKSEIILKDLFLYPSDPEFDKLGSLEISGAIIDECNQITHKAWQISKSRIRYKLKEFDLLPKILGTCNPSKNWVYQNFYKPFTSKTISEKKRFIQALPKDNPHLPESYLENLLSLDKNSRERLYYGNWEYDDDPAALINHESIMNMFTNQFVISGKRYISCDVARFGNDNSIIMVWDGLRIVSIKKLSQKPLNWVASELMSLAQQYEVPNSHIVIDEDGVGGGVVDMVNGCVGFKNNSSPKGNENYENLKTQCYYKLSELINSNKIALNQNLLSDDDLADLIEELEQVKQKDMDKDGKKKIVPKDEVKKILGRSPDFSDAMMMRMYFELAKNKITFDVFVG